MTEPPVCECHGLPCYWHKYNDGRKSGGRWRCRVRKREMDAASDKEAKRERQLTYWHKAEGGYVRRRRRDLSDRRARIVNQLTELEREAGYRA